MVGFSPLADRAGTNAALVADPLRVWIGPYLVSHILGVKLAKAKRLIEEGRFERCQYPFCFELVRKSSVIDYGRSA